MRSPGECATFEDNRAILQLLLEQDGTKTRVAFEVSAATADDIRSRHGLWELVRAKYTKDWDGIEPGDEA